MILFAILAPKSGQICSEQLQLATMRLSYSGKVLDIPSRAIKVQPKLKYYAHTQNIEIFHSNFDLFSMHWSSKLQLCQKNTKNDKKSAANAQKLHFICKMSTTDSISMLNFDPWPSQPAIAPVEDKNSAKPERHCTIGVSGQIKWWISIFWTSQLESFQKKTKNCCQTSITTRSYKILR